jgi:hypothetical protein
MKKQHENIRYKHEFGPEEMRGLAKAMADGHHDMDLLEVEKKATTDTYKARIESKRLEINDAAGKYRDGYEFRDVLADVFYDYARGVVVFSHPDTHAILKERPMTEDEKQITLPMGEDTDAAMAKHSKPDAQDRAEARQ